MVHLPPSHERDRVADDGAEGASPEPEVLDLSDETQVKKIARTAKVRQRDNDEFLLSVMGSKAGRRWIRSELDFCGPFRTCFDSDPYRTAFNAGLQSYGLRLLAEVTRVAPADYIKLLEEQDG